MFEAVKHVTFSVREGDILGIIGKNGSGKSTLLKSIAGVFSPNCGTIDLKGHSVSLSQKVQKSTKKSPLSGASLLV